MIERLRGATHWPTMYSLGQGVPQGYAQAAMWYQKAADQGNTDAQTDLGLMYERGAIFIVNMGATDAMMPFRPGRLIFGLF